MPCLIIKTEIYLLFSLDNDMQVKNNYKIN
jgi:hypothetical protein